MGTAGALATPKQYDSLRGELWKRLLHQTALCRGTDGDTDSFHADSCPRLAGCIEEFLPSEDAALQTTDVYKNLTVTPRSRRSLVREIGRNKTRGRKDQPSEQVCPLEQPLEVFEQKVMCEVA